MVCSGVSSSMVGTVRLVPWLPRNTFGWVSRTLRLVSTRQSAAHASRVRMSVPRLPGISNPSATSTSADSPRAMVSGSHDRLGAPEEGLDRGTGSEQHLVRPQPFSDEEPSRVGRRVVLQRDELVQARMVYADRLQAHPTMLPNRVG